MSDITMSLDDTLELDAIIQNVTNTKEDAIFDSSKFNVSEIQTNTLIFKPQDSGTHDITINGQTLSIEVIDTKGLPDQNTWSSISNSEAFWKNNPIECYYSQTNDGSGSEIYNSGSTAVNDAMDKFFNDKLTSLGTISSSDDTAYNNSAGRRFKFIQENNEYRHYVEEVNENAYHFLSYIKTGFDLSSVSNFYFYHWHTTKNSLSGSALVLREPGTENYEIADILDGSDLPSDGSASNTGPYDVSDINGQRDIICIFDESTGQNPVESKYSQFYFD